MCAHALGQFEQIPWVRSCSKSTRVFACAACASFCGRKTRGVFTLCVRDTFLHGQAGAHCALCDYYVWFCVLWDFFVNQYTQHELGVCVRCQSIECCPLSVFNYTGHYDDKQSPHSEISHLNCVHIQTRFCLWPALKRSLQLVRSEQNWTHWRTKHFSDEDASTMRSPAGWRWREIIGA